MRCVPSVHAYLLFEFFFQLASWLSCFFSCLPAALRQYVARAARPTLRGVASPLLPYGRAPWPRDRLFHRELRTPLNCPDNPSVTLQEAETQTHSPVPCGTQVYTSRRVAFGGAQCARHQALALRSRMNCICTPRPGLALAVSVAVAVGTTVLAALQEEGPPSEPQASRGQATSRNVA